ncbi:MAG: histidine phosphatase family protein [Anaerolineae bacterium]|nr:histidine phosphatase family protein [Anaerolineae bacterium]
MRLYIIRHADPDYANNTLTKAGHLEAQALARRLAAEGLDALYASPLPRAQMTAQYTADLLKLPIYSYDWLLEPAWFDYEIDPADGGKMPVWDIPGEIMREISGYDAWATWSSIQPLSDPKYLEGYQAFVQSSDELLAAHGYQREGKRYRIVKRNQQRIACFCHNGSAMLWLAMLLHIPPPVVWSSFWHAPSAVTTVLFEERSGELAVPRCLSVGDVSHLYEARLPVQPRGIRGNFG